MAQQVQNNENPEAVLKKLGFACFCIYNYLIMHRSGEWNGLREAALPHNL
jgi:DNA-directed RNA polymerase subunit N (RpoN/RPB10)